MRRFLFVMAIACLMLLKVPAIAEVRAFDFDVMSVEELDDLLDDVRAEKKAAVVFSNEAYELLRADFKMTLEGFAPDAVKFDYPLFGLNRDRERTYYAVSGTVTAKYADETETEFKNATAVYWHDEETDSFHQVAFFTRDRVYSVRPEVLKNIERYPDGEVYQRIYKAAQEAGLLKGIMPSNIETTPMPSIDPNPTATLTPTLTPTPTPTVMPTLEPTATPTATPDVSEQYAELKPGSKGQAVLDARMKMYELGYFKKKPTQMEYTRNMVDYVKAFERDYGLEQDGILSPEDQVVLFGS